jgi:N-acyl-D-aspartate/D-glutamate deacylase
VHFGGAFSDQWYRDSIGIRNTASPAQLSRLGNDLDKAINDGWIGLSIDPEYAPYIDTNEYLALGAVAQAADMPLFTHIRYSSPGPAGKGSLDAIDEVLRVARETGVSLHVDHIPSMATHVMPEAIAKIDAARSEGLDVTGCFYPYTFWGTYLGSARFAGDWQTRFRITYGDLQLAGSNERLTAASFKKYQAQNKLVVAYAIPQDDVIAAVKAPWSMVGSDAIPESSNNNHPRGSGCFSRLLGPYVRDLGIISLMDALAKCTILPARRLDARVPMLGRKGRMQMGADADITLFDPATIADTSTVEKPAQMSAGVQYVMVMGRLAKDPTGVIKDVRAGQAIKGQTV